MSTARVRVESIAAGGDGVARADGMAVFIPRTAPGDVVDASLDVRGRFARGAMRAIVEPSRDRVEPPCVHYARDHCGGCQLQHLSYAAQLRAKSAIVRDAIQRIGRRDVERVDVQPSPSEWAYRTKLTLAMRWRGDRLIAGLHPFDKPDAIFQLEECLITDDRVVAIWKQILSVPSMLPRASTLRGAVRLTTDGASFVLEGAGHWPNAAALADRVPELTTVWWEPTGQRRRLLVDRRRELQGESESAGAKSPDASFAQVNPAAAEQLHAHVIDVVMAHAPSVVIDAYAGAGATAIALAERGPRVTAIELDAAAGRWVAANLPDGSRSIVARVEDAIESALPADVVIVNPPRAGVDERVTTALQKSASPSAIVYVSCNPATLARDVLRLPRYRIASMTSFDMFPQTAHVETVCELVPEAA